LQKKKAKPARVAVSVICVCGCSRLHFFSVIRNNLSPQDSSGAALTDGSALVVTLRKEGSSIFASPTPSSAVI